MSVTNETVTGFEAPNRRGLLRVMAAAVGLIAGAVLAVSLASGGETPAVESPMIEAPADGALSRPIQAQIDRLTGLAETYEPLTRGQQAEAQRWAGIFNRYSEEASENAPSTGLGHVDEFEEKIWGRDAVHDPHAAQDELPDF